MTGSINCIHKDERRLCPISKIPCPGECIYSDILENISVGILVFDIRNESVVFQNKAAIDLLEGITPRDYNALSSMLGGVRECFVSRNRPLPMALAYGKKLLGYTIYNIVEGFYWVFVLDVTERRQVETERALLAAAVESAHEAIIIINADGFISYSNPALERTYGHGKEKVLGQRIAVLVRRSGYKWKHFLKLLVRLRRGDVCDERITTKKQDGSICVLDISVFPVRNASGEIMNYVVFQRDVTERVRLESIAEAVNTMNNIGYTFSGIRHEIGNPVNSIKTTLSVLKANLDKFSGETVKVYIDRALTEIARVEYLLKVLKNFNMFESLKLEDVDIESFISMFLSLVMDDFVKKGIIIRCIIHPEARSVRADPRALQQVLLNLLSNASDALGEMESPKIVIQAYKVQRQIKITIMDCGCGISEEEMNHIFKPFFTTKPTGSGLGLVLAKKMLAKMNGLIEVTSHKNAGTIIDITLPEAQKWA
jgi:PAS domain S-box-containing protein